MGRLETAALIVGVVLMVSAATLWDLRAGLFVIGLLLALSTLEIRR